MDPESVKADDTEQFSSVKPKHTKNMKEVEEVLLEIKTICNDEELSNNNLINSNSSEHSLHALSMNSNKESNKKFKSGDSTIPSDFENMSFSHLPEQESSIEGNSSSSKNSPPNSSITLLKQDANCVISSPCSKSNNSDLPSQNFEPAVESNDCHELKKFSEMDIQQESNSNESVDSFDDIRKALRRNSRRKSEYDGYCPVCGVTVRLNDLSTHFNQEVERLSKIQKNLKKPRYEEVTKNKAFEQIRNNRENRLTARVARYSARAKNEVKCPVCSLRMSGMQEEINKHVAYCIQDEDSDEMIVVDNEDYDDQSFEEYEIGDQRRIRPISLVEGGYRSLQGRSTNSTTTVEEDLNVDVDDTCAYGEPQYSELDVIPDATCEKDKEEIDRLRRAVLGSVNIQPNVVKAEKWRMVHESYNETSTEPNTFTSNVVVSSLKEKIKDLEDQNRNVKCLICLEPYSKPLVSTTCWHVHCEECWLMTMGVKKLCPQCNMIVFPSDLRRIYL